MRPSEEFEDGPIDGANDAAMDALLRDFFRREVPPLLPVEPANSPVYSFRERRSWAPSWSLVAIAAGVLAAFGIAHWLLPDRKASVVAPSQPRDVQPVLYASTGEDVLPAVEPPTAMEMRSEVLRDARDREIEFRIASGRKLLDSKAVETPEGAFSQETELRWTTITFVEPSTGQQVEATVPEVQIRIVPVNFQ